MTVSDSFRATLISDGLVQNLKSITTVIPADNASSSVFRSHTNGFSIDNKHQEKVLEELFFGGQSTTTKHGE